MSSGDLLLVCVFAGLTPAALFVIAIAKSGAWRAFAKLRPAARVATILAVLVLAVFGSDKSPVTPAVIMQILTVVSSTGELKDISGMVASGIAQQAVEDLNDQAATIAAGAQSVVATAAVDIAVLTNYLAEADYSAAYIAYDFPRATPAEINHNVSCTIERLQQTNNVLTAYVWFSATPATNVTLYLDCSVASNVWQTMPPITNSYPATTTVGDVACYEYTFTIPTGLQGIPFRPDYDVDFGGPDPNDYLSVPADGVTVVVGSTTNLPYTGWDTYSNETATAFIQVQYVGGLAVELIDTNGTHYTGVNL